MAKDSDACHTRCIGHVPQRASTYRNVDQHGPWVLAHQCRYEAHAFPLVGVLLCRIHAGLRPRRKARKNTDQLELFHGEGA